MTMTAKEELTKLALEEARAKYPNVPQFALVTPRYNVKTANGLTKAIIDYLRFRGYHAERINCMGRVVDNRRKVQDVTGKTRTIGSTLYIPTTMQKGTADISATVAGKSVKIEVKIGRDRQSDYQKEYQRQIESSGGLYFIARNFDQFVEWINLQL